MLFLLSVFSFTSFSRAAEELLPPSLRLRRRATGKDFTGYTGADSDECTQIAYTWAAGWASYAGTISFTAPLSTTAFKYLVKPTDSAFSADKKIRGFYFGDGAVSEIDATTNMFELNPADSFDGQDDLSHYWNLGSSASWDDTMPNPSDQELEIYFCYTPPAIDITYGKLLMDSVDHLGETVANIAAFLAQTSWESATFTACDENNHTGSPTAACTQRPDGALYQDVNSGEDACALDASMTETASTWASWTDGPLECSPDSDTENCCWWGRGSIQTTGPTNYGALQAEVLSKRPGNENGELVDVCRNPGKICSEDDLKWTAGVYFWVTQVQQSSCYVDALTSYVENYDVTVNDYSLTDGCTSKSCQTGCKAFAVGVGGVVNHGEWNGVYYDAHWHDAHGNWVNDANDEVEADEGTDGRVPRFETFMTALKPKIEEYQADSDHSDDAWDASWECTGNTAVDFIINAAGLKGLTEITSDGSKYTWTALCTALKEFID